MPGSPALKSTNSVCTGSPRRKVIGFDARMREPSRTVMRVSFCSAPLWRMVSCALSRELGSARGATTTSESSVSSGISVRPTPTV